MKKIKKNYTTWLIEYTKPHLPKITFIMLCNLSVALLGTVMALVSKQVIDKATNGENIIKLIALYVLCTVILQALDMLGQFTSLTFNEKFSFGIRKQVYEKILNGYWMDIKKYHTGDLMTRLTSDAGNIADGIAYTIPNIIKLILELIAAFVTLFYFQPVLALFALVIGPVCGIVTWWMGRKLKWLTKKVQETESNYRSFMQESLANLLIVKSFNNEDNFIHRLENLRQDRFKWVYKKGKYSIFGSSIMAISFQLAYIVAFSFGAVEISRGLITYGTMSLYITMVNRVQGPVVSMAGLVPKVVSIFASAERVMEIQDLPEEEKSEDNAGLQEVGASIDSLSFSYDAKEKVIDNLSLEIKPGEFLAVIGESGIGKTTLVRLMMSFMSQYEGSISYYDNNGNESKAGSFSRNFISYVPQGNTLFSGTIRDNVLMGKLDAIEDEINEALKLAAAYDFVQEFPNGVDTVIGERGHGISEGQAQRIAIARCLIKKAPLIILDEATSSLDAKTELEVLNNLKTLSPKPTCIIITHRLSVLPYCDGRLDLSDTNKSEMGVA